MALYIAAFGLFISKLDVTAAIYPTIFFFTISIYFFYRLVAYLTHDKKIQTVSTIIYALSPATITFARFFWNPNLIIPFSVFFWFLVLRKYSSYKRKLAGFVLAGLIGGIMVNFHYASLVLILLCFFYYLFKKQLSLFISLFIGFTLGSFPLILFEVKHKFYLTQAFIYNFSHNGSVEDAGNKFLHFFSGVLVILGLKPAEITHPTISLTIYLTYGVIAVLVFLMVKSFSSINKSQRILLIPIFIMNLVAVYMSRGIYNIHYLFPVYPLLIWYVGTLISEIKTPVVTYIILLAMFYSSLLIPYDVHNIKKDYLSLPTIEAIASYIVHDNPKAPYNLTENITGGAQAIPFRFVLERDAKVLPNDKVSYTGLKTLYVITPDINRTYKENRYEFYATPNKVLVETVNFGDVNLYKFDAR